MNADLGRASAIFGAQFTFLDSIRDIRKNKEVLAELDKKLKRLQENPLHMEMEKVVYLNWIDHRKTAYD